MRARVVIKEYFISTPYIVPVMGKYLHSFNLKRSEVGKYSKDSNEVLEYVTAYVCSLNCRFPLLKFTRSPPRRALTNSLKGFHFSMSVKSLFCFVVS